MTDTSTVPRDNPWARDEQGKLIHGPGVMAKAIRDNPGRAIELCRAAGENLDAWFPKKRPDEQ